MGWLPMSNEKKCLALQLKGPLQSWGFDSQYSRRNTGLMPTKSAVAGMICAALGYPRGSEKECDFLGKFKNVSMTAIAVPSWQFLQEPQPVRRLQDYHTVRKTRKAEGGIKETHITHRQYLSDAAFVVLLYGVSALIEECAKHLRNPIWGTFLGRKSCIPALPVLFVRFDPEKLWFESEAEALSHILNGKPLDSFQYVKDAESFEAGTDSLPDHADSFKSIARKFSPRRVIVNKGK
ncbi:MAG TPA: type I-E CRISPR-associated protein Cas5/CasD [Fibrobacteres bacterium]|jgi:CRISPR system Cascade subunit CasD|nr:type I-E CRISPR-associated protein Cas5/CasD [Fibrobacterota bacterium]